MNDVPEKTSGNERATEQSGPRVSRRRFTQRAMTVAGGVAVAGAGINAAASKAFAMPAVISAQDAPVEISFYHIWGTPPGEDAAENKHPAELLIDAFNEQSTTVKVIGETPGNYEVTLQKAQAQLAAGNAPALVTTPWSNIHYADEGLGIINLEDIAGDEFDDVFGVVKENVMPLVTVDGKTKGLPFAFSCPVFYYNADILTQAGTSADSLFTTWEGFADAAPAVQDTLDGNPVIGFAGNKSWQAQTIIQSNGGMVLDDSGSPVMDSPETIAAMAAIAELDSAGLYDRATRAELRPSFLGQSTAVHVGSIAGLSGIRSNANFDLQTATFPAFDGKPRSVASGGSFLGVYAREEEQQQAAWEFLKFALSEEGYAIWMNTGYLNVTSYDLPILEGQEAAYEQLDEGLTAPPEYPTARGAEVQAIWDGYVERIWANDISAEDGCKAAREEIQALLDSM